METEPHRPQQPGMNSHCFLSNCNRHPDEQVTGFCASCLRERLAGLDNDNARRSSTSSATSSAAAALKTIFLSSAIGVNGRPSSSSQRQSCHNKNAAAASSVRPDLRRCKSFAGGPRSAAAVEPRRKSCDVRVRSTLSSLFHQDDRDRILDGRQKFLLSSSTAAATVLAAGEIEVEADSVVVVDASKDELEDVKPMKDHIDLDSSRIKKVPAREVKEIAGSFWLAASIFSKKLQKWRKKQKTNKSTAQHGGIRKPLALQSEKQKIPISSRPFRETQSEIAADSIARRSCDIAPRYSLEAGRISFDERRCSLEDPRASWDGCLLNSGRSLHSRFPVKLAVVEDAVERSDGLIPVEEDTKTPGCSAQTRDYYSDSSSRRRRSLDRSSSSRRHSVVLCDTKRTPNASIPELFHWSKLERESNSFREDCSGNLVSTFRDPVNIPSVKKSRHWSIWGFIHRRNANRAGESQSMERSFSETWPELRVSGTTMQRSSSVSARRSFSTNGSLPSTQKIGLETAGLKKKNKNNKEIVLDKSQSARYSPSHFDNGLLRFYLTPSRGNWRSGMLAKNKFGSPRSFTSNILRFY